MAFHIDINVAVRRAAVLDRVNFSADIQLRSGIFPDAVGPPAQRPQQMAQLQ